MTGLLSEVPFIAVSFREDVFTVDRSTAEIISTQPMTGLIPLSWPPIRILPSIRAVIGSSVYITVALSGLTKRIAALWNRTVAMAMITLAAAGSMNLYVPSPLGLNPGKSSMPASSRNAAVLVAWCRKEKCTVLTFVAILFCPTRNNEKNRAFNNAKMSPILSLKFSKEQVIRNKPPIAVNALAMTFP